LQQSAAVREVTAGDVTGVEHARELVGVDGRAHAQGVDRLPGRGSGKPRRPGATDVAELHVDDADDAHRVHAAHDVGVAGLGHLGRHRAAP